MSSSNRGGPPTPPQAGAKVPAPAVSKDVASVEDVNVEPAEEKKVKPAKENVEPVEEKVPTEAEKFQAMKDELSKKKGPYQVVATRAGFYNSMRIKEGDKFTIAKVSEFGKWMKPI